MIDITDELITRIQQQCPTFSSVGVPSFKDIPDSYSSQTPAALVFLASDETTEDSPATIQSSQQIIQSYGIWVLGPPAQQEQARTELKTALLGWQPEAATGAMHYKKGAAEEITSSLIWWREYWALPVWVRQQ